MRHERKWWRDKKLRGSQRIERMFNRPPLLCHICTAIGKQSENYASLFPLYRHLWNQHGKGIGR